MRFIDANIIVKAFTDNKDKEACRDALNSEFITDSLCIAEAHSAIAAIKQNSEYATLCMKSMFRKHATIVPIGKDVLFEAFRRIEKYNLNIFDMIHYTIALQGGCTEFVSYDRDFNSLEIIRTEPKK